MRTIKFFIEANFYLSVLVLVYGGVTSITEHYTMFDFNEDLFGAMHNNLRMALLYLGLTEIVICFYCYATNQPKLMLFVGYFLVMMLGSLAFYGKINSVPIDHDIHSFFLYTGLSHIIFGLLAGLEDSVSNEYT
ncbi:MAG: hypothetical protein IPN42_08330 [Methylococcaceae bacterium]|nr:hypothetical protein [Methylococcaceae bacterium]